MREHDPDLILYVVDHRQHGHFEQVFRAAEEGRHLRQGAIWNMSAIGTMNGPDGKPFKTRAGGVMKLYDLIAMATEEAESGWRSRGSARDYSPEERAR